MRSRCALSERRVQEVSDVVEIKHRYTGAVLLTYPGANLNGADLSEANLSGAGGVNGTHQTK
jgi:uncharacterized protein YjbI with pentapeptide repeats